MSTILNACDVYVFPNLSGKADKTAWFYQEIILPRNIEQLTYHLRVNGKQKMKDKSVNGLQVSGLYTCLHRCIDTQVLHFGIV